MSEKNDEIFNILRQKAEALFKQTEKKNLQEEFEDVERLLKELEMQQQELKREIEQQKRAAGEISSRSTIEKLNNRMEAALRSGNMAWWELELPSGKVIFNERKATILGYNPQEFTHYTDFTNIVHPDDYESTMDAFRRHLDGTAETYSCEYRIRNSAGGYLWFRDLGKITSRKNGTITLTGIVTEITGVKRTREAMERFRAAVDNSSDQVFLIDRNSMKFVDVNNTACSALEYTREELLSMAPQDIKPEHTLQTLTKELDTVLEEPSGTGVIETLHQSKTGKQIPVEVRLRTFETPGNTYIIAVARDMTEQRKIRDELEVANRRFLTILRHINVGILVVARQSREILYVNPYMQSFYPDPLEHKLCTQVFGYKEDLCPQCPVHFDSGKTEEEKHEFITSEYHLPDIEKYFLLQISPIQWVDKSKAALMILTDITPLKEVEQLKDDIGRITRHDLKNPLTGILGGTQLILMDAESGLAEEHKEYIEMIEESGKRMLAMIDESMGLYKMEKGLYEVQQEEINLDELLKNIVEEHRSFIDGQQINVTFELTPSSEGTRGPFIARGEQLLCYSLFSNIIKNALDASKKRDPVRISLGKDPEGRVDVSVWNRAAVPKEIRHNFGKKYSTWGKTRGTGLGVYSARLMTETQGGKFFWDSSEEAGTTVRVSLPAAR
jgi:PAS domain S-box-containing protein